MIRMKDLNIGDLWIGTKDCKDFFLVPVRKTSSKVYYLFCDYGGIRICCVPSNCTISSSFYLSEGKEVEA